MPFRNGDFFGGPSQELGLGQVGQHGAAGAGPAANSAGGGWRPIWHRPEMESGGADPHGPYGANYSTNWQSQPGTFFTWQDRNNQFLTKKIGLMPAGGRIRPRPIF